MGSPRERSSQPIHGPKRPPSLPATRADAESQDDGPVRKHDGKDDCQFDPETERARERANRPEDEKDEHYHRKVMGNEFE